MRIAKELSANDTGDTGGHQAGILVPKQDDILSFFPPLNPHLRNPRHLIVFRDATGARWEFAFIYYNNKFFGGTRNEYRLTRMTGYIRSHRLRPGDQIIFERDGEYRFTIDHARCGAPVRGADGVLRLGSNWVVIPMARGNE